MTPNVHALAMAGQFITFCRNVCPVNQQKVEIFILLLNRVFLPEPLLNNQQKADKVHVTPSYSPMRLLGAFFIFVSRLKFLKRFLSLKQ